MNLPLKIALGLVGGFSATAPMTAVMLALYRHLPQRKRYPLPPREIVTQFVKSPDRDADTFATLTGHFAYGGAMGALYSATTPFPQRNWAVKGLGAGIAVWSASYFIFLPLLRILRPAHCHPAERNLLMLLAHGVWGVVLSGFLAAVVQDETGKALAARSSRPHRDQFAN